MSFGLLKLHSAFYIGLLGSGVSFFILCACGGGRFARVSFTSIDWFPELIEFVKRCESLIQHTASVCVFVCIFIWISDNVAMN